MGADSVDQGTDGDETTVKDGKTISKFSMHAMKIGTKVSDAVKNTLYAFFTEHAGDDKVFPTKNRPKS